MKRLVIFAAAIAATAVSAPIHPSRRASVSMSRASACASASRAIATTAATTVRSSASVASIVSGTSACGRLPDGDHRARRRFDEAHPALRLANQLFKDERAAGFEPAAPLF